MKSRKQKTLEITYGGFNKVKSQIMPGRGWCDQAGPIAFLGARELEHPGLSDSFAFGVAIRGSANYSSLDLANRIFSTR